MSAGLGFTIVTSSMSKLFAKELSYIPLADPEVEVDYGLALRENDPAPTVEALRTVAQHFGKLV